MNQRKNSFWGYKIVDKKFFLNENTRKLHIVGGCCQSKVLPYQIKYFETEDEVIAKETRYFSYCKICFKEK